MYINAKWVVTENAEFSFQQNQAFMTESIKLVIRSLTKMTKTNLLFRNVVILNLKVQ